MKRSPFACILAAVLSCHSPASAQSDPKEEDFLIFDKIEEDQKAVPAAPTPAPTESETPSKRPLPAEAGEAVLRTILLEVPEKSFATARLAKLTATASQRGDAAVPAVQFSDATVTLNASIERAAKLISAADPKFPDGVQMKVMAEGGYEAHEHDAAAAATAVLLEAAAGGRAIDSEVALLGGVDDKGRITAVNRLATRLRTLEGTLPAVVGVPMVSESEVRDLALMNEYDVLAHLQVISLVTLDDARDITAKKRPEKIAKAFELFATVREAATATPIATLLKNAKFLERLREITTLMPNHLSAKLLLMGAGGKVPGRITYATSRQAILKAIKPFVASTSSGKSAKEIQTVATDAGNVLLRMQPKIHPNAERYLMAMKAYLRSVTNYLDIPNSPQHYTARNRAAGEINKLLAVVELEKQKLDQSEARPK